ncbi:unnamed protein product [Auanema sp. JU1783]|nr:unnamed protein product [Auanema sp. JU1783]
MTLEDNRTVQSLTHLFVELTSLDGLNFPTSSSKRIKFTCIASSTRYLVLGTTTGTIYVFSRYRQKRSGVTGSALPPVDIFLIKDGPVNTIVVSSNEQYIGIGSDSGRVSVINLTANEQKSAIIYSVPGDARKPDKVGALCWTKESKNLIAGHSSGIVNLHRFDSRSVFRSSHDTLCELTAEVIQMDTNSSNNLLLISTTAASHIYDLENNTVIQVGKKTRNSKMGACFLHSADQSCGDFVVAARPNGRVWECNTVGVVYRTHQLRLSPSIPRYSTISFRSSFEGQQKEDENSVLESAINMDVNFGLLYRISCDSKSLALTCCGSKFIVADPDSSHVVLMTDIHEDILDVSVFGSDVFVLLSGSTFLKKFSLLSLTKAAEKLKARNSFSQAAQLIIHTIEMPVWEKSLITEIIEGLSKYNKKNENDYKQLRNSLLRDLCKIGAVSAYDNLPHKNECYPTSSRLPSGIYRVHSSNIPDDHFGSFLPSSMRERSVSSPNFDHGSSTALLQKRASMPITNDEVQLSNSEASENVRADILTKAREILETDGQIAEVDSLRVLLQLDLVTNNDILRFVPTVTTANVARTLAELSISPRVDLPRVTVDRKVSVGRIKRSGPTIVKPIRPNQIKKTGFSRKSAIQNVAVESFAASPHIEPNSNCVISKKEVVMNIDITNDHENNEVEIMEGDWLHNRLQHLKNVEEQAVALSPEPALVEHASSREVMIDNTNGCLRCSECGIHKSWIAVSLLSSVCKRVRMEEDLFENGAVPFNFEQWKIVFKKHLSKTSATICPKCEVCIETSKKIPASEHLLMSSNRPKISGETLKERILGGDESRLMKILCPGSVSRKDTGSSAASSKQETTIVANGPSSVEEIDLLDTKEYPLFDWVSIIDMRALISMCCAVIGTSEFLKLARQLPQLKSAMNPSCWSSLVTLIVRENVTRHRLVKQTTISDVITRLGLDGILTVDSSPVTSPRRSLMHNAPAPIYSWIVHPKKMCLICTLPLQLENYALEYTVSSFSCGHLYHTQCLSGKRFCIACHVKARKAAAQSRTVRL